MSAPVMGGTNVVPFPAKRPARTEDCGVSLADMQRIADAWRDPATRFRSTPTPIRDTAEMVNDPTSPPREGGAT